MATIVASHKNVTMASLTSLMGLISIFISQPQDLVWAKSFCLSRHVCYLSWCSKSIWNGGNLRTWPVCSGADSEELSWCRHPVTMSPRCWSYSYLTPEHHCFLLEELGRQWSGFPDAAASNLNIVGDSKDLSQNNRHNIFICSGHQRRGPFQPPLWLSNSFSSDHDGMAFRCRVVSCTYIYMGLCTAELKRLQAFLSGSAATPCVHLHLNNDVHCWTHHLICQAQRWEEDLPDNKLMKMSLTFPSISVFHVRSTEHINIAVRKLHPSLLSWRISLCDFLPYYIESPILRKPK